MYLSLTKLNFRCAFMFSNPFLRDRLFCVVLKGTLSVFRRVNDKSKTILKCLLSKKIPVVNWINNGSLTKYLLSFKLKHIWLRSEFLEEELRKVFLGGGGLT